MLKVLFIVPIIMICALVGTVGMINSIEKNNSYETIENNRRAEIDTDYNSNVVKENENKVGNNEKYNSYEDDEKIVFDRGVYKCVYYYNGDKVIGLERLFYYGDSTIASRAIEYLKKAYSGNNISSVHQRGEYVIVKYNAEEYGGKTVQEIKEQYKNFQYKE